MKYWLMKSEPDAYSIDDLENHGVTPWEGVRNYQARNIMRDDMKVGDMVLFYHSNTKPPGVVGLGTIMQEGYPDHFAFDPTHKYFDPKSDPENPRWMMVDVGFHSKLEHPVSLDALKANPKLDEMLVVQRGQRLSVQPVEKKHFDEVLRMARVD